MTKVYSYTVKPKMRFSRFPLDMLRYDQAWPSDPASVAGIETPPQDRPEQPLVAVRLVSMWSPTVARWDSFGWNVEDLKKERR